MLYLNIIITTNLEVPVLCFRYYDNQNNDLNISAVNDSETQLQYNGSVLKKPLKYLHN